MVLGLSVVDPKPFPSWIPGQADLICAKFDYYYERRCFGNYSEIILDRTEAHKREPRREKLQGKTASLPEIFRHKTMLIMTTQKNSTIAACNALMITIGKCLEYFNDLCSSDYLFTGHGDFTPATTGEMMKLKVGRVYFSCTNCCYLHIMRVFLSTQPSTFLLPFTASNSKAALAKFRDNWNQKFLIGGEHRGGMDINRCTVYGGKAKYTAPS